MNSWLAVTSVVEIIQTGIISVWSDRAFVGSSLEDGNAVNSRVSIAAMFYSPIIKTHTLQNSSPPGHDRLLLV